MIFAIYKNETGRPLSATLGNGAEVMIYPGKEGKLPVNSNLTNRWLAHGFISFVRVPEKKQAIAPKVSKSKTKSATEG